MARLDELVGAREYDDIFAGATPTALVGTILLAEGNGVLKRGTIVSGTAGEGLEAVSAALGISASGSDSIAVAKPAVYVLAEDVDTGDSGSSTVEAFAYKTGCFARQRLLTDGEYEMTAADWEYLRGEGIITEDIL